MSMCVITRRPPPRADMYLVSKWRDAARCSRGYPPGPHTISLQRDARIHACTRTAALHSVEGTRRKPFAVWLTGGPGHA